MPGPPVTEALEGVWKVINFLGAREDFVTKEQLGTVLSVMHAISVVYDRHVRRDGRAKLIAHIIACDSFGPPVTQELWRKFWKPRWEADPKPPRDPILLSAKQNVSN
jgi:hypothetical protein